RSLAHLRDDDGALQAGVLRQLAKRLLERPDDDRSASPLVGILDPVELDRVDRVDERDAATRDDALLEGSPRGLQRVLDAMLLLLHLRFGRGADLDDGDTARELGKTLLELLAVEVGVG